MKVNVVVENHQPVPMRRLGDVVDDLRNARVQSCALYLEPVVTRFGRPDLLPGWYIWRPFSPWVTVTGDDFPQSCLHYEKTLARALQPGERLLVTFEG